MGRQEVMGLGKSNQGQTSIIQAEYHVSTAELGAKGGSVGHLKELTCNDCVKKMIFAHYQELSEQEQDSQDW
jgi:RNA-binding protein 5/10